jgi:hypothetical protein
MEKIIFAINVFIVIIAGLSTVCTFKIWKLTVYNGMLCLAISLFYATILRVIILFGFSDEAAYLMIIFWVGLLISLFSIYKQTKKVLEKQKQEV